MSSATARSKRRRVSNGPLEPEKKSRVPPSRSHSKPQAGGGHGGSRASEGVRAPSVAPEDVVPPAALPLRPAARRACAGILDFFSDTGVDVSWRNVRFDPDELSGGWRVVAARDVARGEVLGTVPKSACLSVSSTLLNMPAQHEPTSRTPPQMRLPCCKSSSHAALAARRRSWSPRTLHECSWPPPMLHECSWPPRMLHECSWSPRMLHECSWSPRMLHECSWPPRMLHECSWPPRMLHECSWPPRMLYECSWPPRMLYECSWPPRMLHGVVVASLVVTNPCKLRAVL
jgi:hypothetical protein